MPQGARVLVVGHNESTETRLSSRLRLCGCDCENIDLTGPDRPGRDARRADVVILNLLSDLGRKSPRDFVDFARRLRRRADGPLLPVLMLGGSDPAHTACALEAAANSDIDDVMLSPVNDLQIVERIRSLMRLNTMHDELVRRLNTSARYGIDAPVAVPGACATVEDAHVLVVGASASYATIEGALSHSATLVGALTTSTASEYLERNRFEIIIVDVPEDPEEALAFVKGCRANSKLFNTPIILLAKPGVVPDTSPVFLSGVTDLMANPPHREELQVRVQALVREVRFRESLREVYAKARHMATSDALTGLYSRGFALEHIKSLIEAADARGLPFTVAHGSIDNINEINMLHGYVVGDRMIRQVGDVLGLLTRGEDLSVRYSGARFLVLLPDTTAGAAQKAINRILGVMNHTDFTIAEIAAPVPVMMSIGVVGYRDGDTPEGIVARAVAKTNS